MDFQRLLKQAANNQATKQKELESKKKEIKHEVNSTKLQEIKKKREAKKKLDQYEEETIKSRLIYHGLASSSGSPLKRIATPSASTASKTSPSSQTNNDTRHSQALSSKKTKNMIQSSKGSKSKSVPPTSSLSSSSTSNPVKKDTLSKPKNSSVTSISKSKTPPPPGRSKSSAMPTDFQELLKIAQKNSAGGKPIPSGSTTAKVLAKESTKELMHKSTNPGIGRSLLDKSAKPNKHKPAVVETYSSQNSDSKESQSNELKKNYTAGLKKTQTSSKSHQPHENKEKKETTSTPTNVRDRVDPYPRPYPRPYEDKKIEKQAPSQNSGSVTKRPIAPQDKVRDSQIRNSANPDSRGYSQLPSRGRGGPPVKSRNPNKFYSASARLITDKSSGSSSGVPMYGYRSTWADEMSEYLRNNRYELEEEDEEEFDDFVVDEAEEGDWEGGYEGEEDYSSAIRSIFGDRYRSVNNDQDDEVMESSFAQQQFEEMRSARIGRLEDEEDIRKEREEMNRKRKLKTSNNASSKKQMKL